MEDNRRFSWSDLFIKVILVIIFILFTVWLLSLSNKGISNSLNVLTDDIFVRNIERMKEVGKEYFTIERLPENVGDVKTLTLEKMYDEKLILELRDKYGNSCSAENSYVSIEKYDTEYQMKVYLECEEESDYIIVIMGCYDYCDTDICEKKDQEKLVEYEYKKTTGGYWTDYNSWSNWSKTSVTKTDYRQVETKVVNEEYSYDKTVTETLYDEVQVTCPSGYKKTSDGTKCYKEDVTYDYKTPVCPDRTGEGFKLLSQNGFTCNYSKSVSVPYQVSYQVAYQSPYKVVVGKQLVSSCSGCAAQWQTIYETRYETKYRTEYKTEYKTETVTDSTTLSCSSGYSQLDNKCVKTVTNYDYKDIVKSCPTKYSLTNDETKCYMNVDTIVKETGTRDVTYYRYRVREFVGGTTDYKWSTSKNDKELLDAGYILTGKTR